MGRNVGRVIADPIHGRIALDEQEAKLVDSAPVQRLRRIKQLGNVHLVYPGATHTRFAHSLGVMQIAGRMYDAILARRWKQSPGSSVAEARNWVRKHIRVAGLLHDLGHGPYSHLFEKCLDEYEYSDLGEELQVPRDWWNDGASIEDMKLKHEHLSYGLIHCLLQENAFASLDPQAVCSLLDERIKPSGELNERLEALARGLGVEERSAVTSLQQCLKCLLSSEIDADRIDYLRRDAYYAGVEMAGVDLEHLLSSVHLEWDQRGGEFYLEIRENAVSVVERILVSRKQMFDHVYTHRVSGVFDELLGTAMAHLKAELVGLPLGYQEFVGLVDATVDAVVERRLRTEYERETLTYLDQDEMTAAAAFWTRAVPLRQVEEVVDAAKQAEREAELQRIHGESTRIWVLKLKEFARFERDRTSSDARTLHLRLEPKYPNVPPRELSSVSEVFRSNLWRVDRVRFVVTKRLDATCQERGVAARLRQFFGGAAGAVPAPAQPSEAEHQSLGRQKTENTD